MMILGYLLGRLGVSTIPCSLVGEPDCEFFDIIYPNEIMVNLGRGKDDDGAYGAEPLSSAYSTN